MIRAVCFDFDGTLAHFSGDFEGFVDSFRGELMLTQCEMNGFAEQLSRELRHDGKLTLLEAARITLEASEQQTPTDLPDLVAKALDDYSSQVTLLPGARALLEFCRARSLPLALITNGPADMQRAAVRAVGIGSYFNRILVSGDAEVAVRKPHPRIFVQACEALGTRPGETLMVGDNPEADLQGAWAAGMQAVGVGTGTPGGVPDLYALETWLDARL